MSEFTAVAEGRSTDQHLEGRLRKAQAVAGGLFAVFLVLHLANFMLAPFGIAAFVEFQRTVRVFYQFPLVELFVVLGPLLVHAICGLWLMWLHRASRGRQAWHVRMHRWAGIFLLVFVIGHITAVRGPSFFYGVYPEFEGLSFSLWFFPYYFYPYYFLLALAGFYHVANGVLTLLRRSGMVHLRAIPVPVVVLASTWFVVSLLALGGHFFEVPDPRQSAFGLLYAELLGMELEPVLP